MNTAQAMPASPGSFNPSDTQSTAQPPAHNYTYQTLHRRSMCALEAPRAAMLVKGNRFWCVAAGG